MRPAMTRSEQAELKKMVGDRLRVWHPAPNGDLEAWLGLGWSADLLSALEGFEVRKVI